MKHSIRVAISGVVLLCSFTACGQETPYPVGGQFRLKGSASAIEFACSALRDNVINCKFMELNVWEVPSVSLDDAPNSKRACIFDAHPFQQTLQLKPTKGVGGKIEWVTDSGPSGECQLLRRASFIGRETEHGIDWEYLVELKALEKSKEVGPLRCWELKEVEARYTQGGPDARAECSTVRFSASCFSPDFSCMSGPPVSNH
jgi:hypothetical protein